jgi:hypothetical protein
MPNLLLHEVAQFDSFPAERNRPAVASHRFL